MSRVVKRTSKTPKRSYLGTVTVLFIGFLSFFSLTYYLLDLRHEHDVENCVLNLAFDHYKLDVTGNVVDERSTLAEQILYLPIIYFIMNTNRDAAVTKNFLQSFKVLRSINDFFPS